MKLIPTDSFAGTLISPEPIAKVSFPTTEFDENNVSSLRFENKLTAKPILKFLID
jgi:hypothetical protein